MEKLSDGAFFGEKALINDEARGSTAIADTYMVRWVRCRHWRLATLHAGQPACWVQSGGAAAAEQQHCTGTPLSYAMV